MSARFEREHINSIEFKNAVYCHKTGFDSLGPITIKFEPDVCYWIPGASGSGKSTLLRALAGAIIPQAGTYLVNEKNMADFSFEEFLPLRLNIGYGSSRGGLLNNRTLRENVMLPILYHGRLTYDDAKKYAEELMTKMEIQRYMDMRPSVVPSGALKLTSLIRAIALEPQILVLDDTTASLGPDATHHFNLFIEEYIQTHPNTYVFMVADDEHFLPNHKKHEIHIMDGQVNLIQQFEYDEAGSL